MSNAILKDGKCWHYANVDEGFYCWKCVQYYLRKQLDHRMGEN